MNLPGFTAEVTIYRSDRSYPMRTVHFLKRRGTVARSLRDLGDLVCNDDGSNCIPKGGGGGGGGGGAGGGGGGGGSRADCEECKRSCDMDEIQGKIPAKQLPYCYRNCEIAFG